MDLTLSPSEEAFRDELRGWLEANHPGEPPERRGEGVRVPPPLAAQAARGRLGRHLVAEGVRRPRRDADRAGDLLRGDGPRQRARAGERARPRDGRPGRDRPRHRGAEAALPRADPVGGGDLVPGLLGARRRLRPRLAEDARGQGTASWVVTGQKVWTTLAHVAKWCMLVARTDPDAPKHQGLTYFLMDMEQDGVEVKPLVQITGEAEFNEIFMEEARIPDENVVGGVGNGWGVAITTLMNERAGPRVRRAGGAQDRTCATRSSWRSQRRATAHRRRGPGDPPPARPALHRGGDLPRHQLPRAHQDHEERRAGPGGLARQVAVGRHQPGA